MDNIYVCLEYNYKGSQNSFILIEVNSDHTVVSLYSDYNEKMFEGTMRNAIMFMNDLVNNKLA